MVFTGRLNYGMTESSIGGWFLVSPTLGTITVFCVTYDSKFVSFVSFVIRDMGYKDTMITVTTTRGSPCCHKSRGIQ